MVEARATQFSPARYDPIQKEKEIKGALASVSSIERPVRDRHSLALRLPKYASNETTRRRLETTHWGKRPTPYLSFVHTTTRLWLFHSHPSFSFSLPLSLSLFASFFWELRLYCVRSSLKGSVRPISVSSAVEHWTQVYLHPKKAAV